MDKYFLYKFLFPRRRKLQIQLLEYRSQKGFDDFCNSLELSKSDSEVPRILWDWLVKAAFVRDFKPDVDDDLSEVYAIGPEEIMDDLIRTRWKGKIDTAGIGLLQSDLERMRTPRDVSRLLISLKST